MLERDDEVVKAVRHKLEQLRQQREEIDQAIYSGEKFLAVLQGLPEEGLAVQKRERDAKTNAEVLLNALRTGPPEGLLVSELVQTLRELGHRLSRARDPIKATSNELALLRKRNLVFKDTSTGKYRAVPAQA